MYKKQSKNNTNKNYNTHYEHLIEIQNFKFQDIIDELNTNQKKTTHWNWYVFPYNEVGPSDTYKTRLDNDDTNLLKYLEKCDFKKWIEILKLILDIIKTKKKGWIGCMPSIDHHRMQKSITFWLNKFDNDKTKKFINYIELKNILKKLENAKTIKTVKTVTFNNKPSIKKIKSKKKIKNDNDKCLKIKYLNDRRRKPCVDDIIKYNGDYYKIIAIDLDTNECFIENISDISKKSYRVSYKYLYFIDVDLETSIIPDLISIREKIEKLNESIPLNPLNTLNTSKLSIPSNTLNASIPLNTLNASIPLNTLNASIPSITSNTLNTLNTSNASNTLIPSNTLNASTPLNASIKSNASNIKTEIIKQNISYCYN